MPDHGGGKGVNLEAYFDRIALPEAARRNRSAELDFLRQLITLHSQSIAFENLNTLMRLPVPLDLAALQAKLVGSPRGGFCFEQNGLFAAVLEAIGYRVRPLAARVVWGRSPGSSAENPRTHMVVLVDIARQKYLCDVGFGGITPTAPLALVSDTEQATPHEPFRLRALDDTWLLQVAVGGNWR
ncbi:MAG TPA: arylamine N-acetyltransferase, partial [Gammaproteobacteria bacterium]|nr:arylamine N-acetyltransferase [Gammaproteobacteria bacterium]